MGLNKRLIDQAGGAASIDATEHFTPLKFTGTGASNSITGVGFQPDLMILKSRSFGDNWYVQDSIRGASRRMYFNLTAAEFSSDTNRVTSFDSDGFTLGSDNSTNQSGQTFITYSFKGGGASTTDSSKDITAEVSANQESGFSIITYTGATNSTTDSSNNGGSYWTLPHGLSEAPELIIIKTRSGQTNPWIVGSSVGSMSFSAGDEMRLNTNSAKGTQGNILFGGYNPTSTEFKVGGWDAVNRNGYTYVAYCFHSVDGYQKIGTYTGGGNTDISVTTDFQPRFLMMKATGVTEDWVILDAARDTSDPRNTYMFTNLQNAEFSSTAFNVDFDTNGFTITGNAVQINQNGQEYLYWAIA